MDLPNKQEELAQADKMKESAYDSALTGLLANAAAEDSKTLSIGFDIGFYAGYNAALDTLIDCYRRRLDAVLEQAANDERR